MKRRPVKRIRRALRRARIRNARRVRAVVWNGYTMILHPSQYAYLRARGAL